MKYALPAIVGGVVGFGVQQHVSNHGATGERYKWPFTDETLNGFHAGFIAAVIVFVVVLKARK